MSRIGLIWNGVWSQYVFATAPKYRDLYRLLYVHDLDEKSLEGLDALVIPFQSNQPAIARRRELLYGFLGRGGKIAVFGDSSPLWLDATWEHRPVDNYWWVEHPDRPPVTETDDEHPIYKGLAPRHACWHIHGVYTRIPEGSRVIQRNAVGEVITWETERYGGTLLGSTLDPIVEHGVQQIRHLDHYVDNLTAWLCGERPEGPMTIDPDAFGGGPPQCPKANAAAGISPSSSGS